LGLITLDTTAPLVSQLNDAPDPFNPLLGQTTTISFNISEPAYLTLKIFNKNGTLIRTLLSSSYATTLTQNIVWNGKSNSKAVVPAGTYSYKLWVTDKARNNSAPSPLLGTVTVN